MKKILMVTEAFGGGVFSYVSQLCNDMCDYFEIYLAYSAQRSETPKDYKKFFDPRVHLIEVEDFEKKNLKNIFKIVKVIKRLRKIEKEIHPDIIHLHSSIAGGIGRLAFKGKNNKVIYTPHGFAHILLGPGLKSKIYEVLEKILGKTNSIILTCCESEDKEAKKFSNNTVYIETGINIKDLNMSLDQIPIKKMQNLTVFSLGRICKQKRPELFNQIALQVPEVNFIWVGGGELVQVLNAPNIKVTGWLPRKEALAIAKGANIFILCSYGEAIAMSLLENMFIKKLCLVSNTIGNQSVIKNGVNGFLCNSVDDYVNHIKDAVIKFPTQLINKAYDDVINIYNTNTMAEKYVQFYNYLIKK
ncbi:glycosyltransferase [Phascolarctobacterium faecium]|nr:glycosyltransferase [Phascolarctobacterium faecium]MDM8111310.1 glycosyltransferase [Phascolarctobacterium faecium]